MNWLKRDAVNRLWRTFWQAVGATIVAGLVDLGYQTLDRVLTTTASGAVVDWKQVWTVTGHAALLVVIMPILAYLHRTKLDPSTVPSLTPPPAPARRA